MKAKSSLDYWFWLRWIVAAMAHSVLQTGVWVNEIISRGNPFFIFGSGIFLALLQYWAMTETMRPSAKRWLLGSVAAYILAMLLQNILISMRIPYTLNFLAVYLPIAVLQSWALSERFRPAWIYGISFIPAYILDVVIHSQFVFIRDISQNYYIDALIKVGQAIIWGIALSILQKYYLKEASLLEEAQ